MSSLTAVKDLMHTGTAQASGGSDNADRSGWMGSTDRVVSCLDGLRRLSSRTPDSGERLHLDRDLPTRIVHATAGAEANTFLLGSPCVYGDRPCGNHPRLMSVCRTTFLLWCYLCLHAWEYSRLDRWCKVG